MYYIAGYKIWTLISICFAGIIYFLVSFWFTGSDSRPFLRKLFSPLFKGVVLISLCGLLFLTGFKISFFINQVPAVQAPPIFSGMDLAKDYTSPAVNLSDLALLKSAKDTQEAVIIINRLYNKFKNNLGVTIGDDPEMTAFVFSSILSHISAPYGKSRETEFLPLLREDSLDCDNYVMLAVYIFESILPKHQSEYEIVGFNGGAIGNHAQLFYKKDSLKMMSDPCYGFVANTRFNNLLEGKHLAKDQLFVFKWRDPKTEDAAQNTIEAVIKGRYAPRDLLYYFNNVDTFASYGEKFSSFEEMIKSFTTPAGQKMYKELTKNQRS
jgi:hypothetical protein